MKLSEAFNEYIEENCVPRGNTERVIKAARARAVVIARRTGDPEVESITLADVAEFRNNMAENLSVGTQRVYLGFIRQTLRWQALKGRDVLNYQLVVMPREMPFRRQALTPEEVERMEEAALKIRDRLLISLLYTSGIRISELLSLQRDSINDCRFFVIGKGRKGRDCFTDKKTMALLELYLKQRTDSNPALFVSFRGKLISPQLIDIMLKRTAKRAGIDKPVSAHVFRHSFATNLAESNVNAFYIQQLLGHKEIATTALYAHPSYVGMGNFYRKNVSRNLWQKHHSSGIIRR